MKREYTEFELKEKVSAFYNGFLNIDKCIKLFNIEFGFLPTIIEDNSKTYVNTTVLDRYSAPECVTVEALTYMKRLQESAIVNMFMSTPEIQKNLFVDAKEAKIILNFYITHYEEIYYPENIVLGL